MMHLLARVERALFRVESLCAVALLVAIVCLVAVASIARAVGSPIIWSIEVAQLAFVWLCILSADLALQKGRHFGLSILIDAMSPRAQRILQLVNMAILAALLVLLLVYAWRNTVLMHPRLFGATQMHGSWLHASMVVGFALMLRTVFTRFLQTATGTLPGPAAGT
ncbi:TRAP transporter small permease [Chachezhania antarctica]|uniref:TRAP transporter small permease n=1 Tax=Chachezhania antarctica TaxID=2340860 RepID=UPI001969124C|nr:TRAP transporter small permease subunit [Chachezhania antarctica]|tara:strand:- start:3392 stop:3889 length:498 start_codon:yes stop_codon:yes gene_type:complete